MPAMQSCVFAANASTSFSATATLDVTDLDIVCTNLYTIQASVGGLDVPMALQLTVLDAAEQVLSVEDLAVVSDGIHPFSAILVEGEGYTVVISEQPIGQDCLLSNDVGSAITSNISVTVACANLLSVAGSISNLNGLITVDLNSGFDSYSVDDATGLDIAYAFSAQIRNDGSAYTATITAMPATQSCVFVANASTTITDTPTLDVTDLNILCTDF